MYVGAFAVAGNVVRVLGEEQVATAETVILPDVNLSDWLVAGEAAELLDGRWGERRPRFVADAWPRASVMLEVGAISVQADAGATEEFATPVYLQAGQPWKKSRN